MIFHYLPVLTTLFGLWFFKKLFVHWRENPNRLHVLWWMIGVCCYVIGTVSESVNTLASFSIINFKLWYVSGALLGGAPLAQGTVYLLCKERTAHILTAILISVITVTAFLVILSPVNESLIDGRLSGKLLEWQFIRYITPLINLYAFVFLVGGAVYSAIKYSKIRATAMRYKGNVLIAVGGLLPGIGGSFTKFGYVEVLYVTELIGLVLIYAGYHFIKNDPSVSVHINQLSSDHNFAPIVTNAVRPSAGNAPGPG